MYHGGGGRGNRKKGRTPINNGDRGVSDMLPASQGFNPSTGWPMQHGQYQHHAGMPRYMGPQHAGATPGTTTHHFTPSNNIIRGSATPFVPVHPHTPAAYHALDQTNLHTPNLHGTYKIENHTGYAFEGRIEPIDAKLHYSSELLDLQKLDSLSNLAPSVARKTEDVLVEIRKTRDIKESLLMSTRMNILSDLGTFRDHLREHEGAKQHLYDSFVVKLAESCKSGGDYVEAKQREAVELLKEAKQASLKVKYDHQCLTDLGEQLLRLDNDRIWNEQKFANTMHDVIMKALGTVVLKSPVKKGSSYDGDESAVTTIKIDKNVEQTDDQASAIPPLQESSDATPKNDIPALITADPAVQKGQASIDPSRQGDPESKLNDQTSAAAPEISSIEKQQLKSTVHVQGQGEKETEDNLQAGQVPGNVSSQPHDGQYIDVPVKKSKNKKNKKSKPKSKAKQQATDKTDAADTDIPAPTTEPEIMTTETTVPVPDVPKKKKKWVRRKRPQRLDDDQVTRRPGEEGAEALTSSRVAN